MFKDVYMWYVKYIYTRCVMDTFHSKASSLLVVILVAVIVVGAGLFGIPNYRLYAAKKEAELRQMELQADLDRAVALIKTFGCQGVGRTSGGEGVNQLRDPVDLRSGLVGDAFIVVHECNFPAQFLRQM